MNKNLADALSDAYAAKVMHKGDLGEVLKRFSDLMADPAFAAEATAELKRARSVPARKCFATKVAADFLAEALAFAEKQGKE